MSRKIGLVALLLSFGLIAGCGKKMTCKSIAEKNKKCSQAFIEEAKKKSMKNLEKIPENMREKMKAQFEEQAKKIVDIMTGDEFIKMCEKELGKAKKEEKEKYEKCFKKSDCKEYVECMNNIK